MSRSTTRFSLLVLFAAAFAGCASGPSNGPSAENAPEYHQPPKNAFEEAFAKEDGVAPVRWCGWMKTLTEGTGASPNPDSTVTVHYRGTLTDGTEFDSSYKRGQPTTFPLRNVIPCWTFGVPMMKVGGKAKFVCPSKCAYGDEGHPPDIPGGATLVFEIELLNVDR